MKDLNYSVLLVILLCTGVILQSCQTTGVSTSTKVYSQNQIADVNWFILSYQRYNGSEVIEQKMGLNIEIKIKDVDLASKISYVVLNSMETDQKEIRIASASKDVLRNGFGSFLFEDPFGHRISLGRYELRFIFIDGGFSTTQTININPPGTLDRGQFVYVKSVDMGKKEGVSGNPIALGFATEIAVRSTAAEAIAIEFRVDDDRVNNGNIYLYGSDHETLIGYSKEFIQKTTGERNSALNKGQLLSFKELNTYQLDYNDIVWLGRGTKEDVACVAIALYDGKQHISKGFLVFDYMSRSNFVDLPKR